MNDQSTNFLPILLAKFPEVKLDELSRTKLNIFLTFNFYNEKYVTERERTLYFRNLNNGTKSIAYLTASKENNSIQFIPEKEANVDEAVAFSYCDSQFICVKINKQGMFIEKQSFQKSCLETEYYDDKALEAIVGRDCPDNIIIRLKRILQEVDYSFEELPNMIATKYGIRPDASIKAGSCVVDSSQKLLVELLRDEVAIDFAMAEFTSPLSLYEHYFSFMKDKGFYSDSAILRGIKRNVKYPPWIEKLLKIKC